jgi:RNA polymerase sigma factor (sigma-70 family)
MTEWSAIVKQHGPLVWQTLYRLLAQEADAADCFQQVFLAALQFAQRETVHHWPALLKRLATTMAMDHLRARYRHGKRQEPLESHDAIDARLHEPAAYAMEQELADELRHALTELEPMAAELFCLAHFDGWSHEAIAREWGLTSNHVGVLISRTRSQLRHKLSGYLHSAALQGDVP